MAACAVGSLILGQGKYGTVYNTTDPKIACKRYKGVGLSIDFLTEVSALTLLRDNPYTPTILSVEFSSFNGRIYIPRFMMSLDAYIASRKIPNMTDNLKIVGQLLSGLDFAHKMGIFHRDFKPQNILIDVGLQISICDWGTSQYIGFDDQTTNIQSLHCRAPEVILGLQPYTSKIDIWGVGCILLSLLGHDEPMYGHNPVETLIKIFSVRGTPEVLKPWFPDFPPRFLELQLRADVETLLLGLLNLNPVTRFDADQALKLPIWKNYGLDFSNRPVPPPRQLRSLEPIPNFPEIWLANLVAEHDLCSRMETLIRIYYQVYVGKHGDPRDDKDRILVMNSCFILACKVIRLENRTMPSGGKCPDIFEALGHDIFQLDYFPISELVAPELILPKIASIETYTGEDLKFENLTYSPRYADSKYLYRMVHIGQYPTHVPLQKYLFTQDQWKAYGVQQHSSWEHYATFELYPNILLFKMPITV
jgi:serine/threonine protein kinase